MLARWQKVLTGWVDSSARRWTLIAVPGEAPIESCTQWTTVMALSTSSGLGTAPTCIGPAEGIERNKIDRSIGVRRRDTELITEGLEQLIRRDV